MPLPDPRLGLVISYSYLWHHEARAGFDEGRKNRPCVIVAAVITGRDGSTLVRVVPVTHTPPDDADRAMEIPAAVKRHLGLDDQRSWIITDEVNEFVWPGFDLAPIPGATERFAYGFITPRLFEQLLARMREIWAAGAGKSSRRS